jgi:peptidyl-prolyl cis-trans isomerase SurA
MQMIRKFFLALWCLSLASLALAEGQSIDGIAAIVNKSIITQSQLHQQMNLYRQQLQQQNSPIPEAAVLKEKVLDGLIAIQLQLQMAKKLNINVTDSEVTEAIAKIASQNHLSVAQMREALARQGMSFASYRAQIK